MLNVKYNKYNPLKMHTAAQSPIGSDLIISAVAKRTVLELVID